MEQRRRHTHSTTAALEDAIALMARNMIEEENQSKIRMAHAMKINQILGVCRKGPHEYNPEKPNGGTKMEDLKEKAWIGFDGVYVIEKCKLHQFISIVPELLYWLKSMGDPEAMGMARIIQGLLNELEGEVVREN